VALRVGVLGPVMAWYGDQELPVGQPRQQAVLGILAMRANRVISRQLSAPLAVKSIGACRRFALRCFA